MFQILVSMTLAAATISAPADAVGGKKKAGGKLAALFARIDTDKNGSISLEEFKKFAESKGKGQHAEKKFAKLDTNGDGQISKHEFAAKFQKTKKKAKT